MVMMAQTSDLHSRVAQFSQADKARAELALRELARRRLIDFCAYVDKKQGGDYHAKHLRLIAEYLEAAERDELWRDVPGYGKKILIITTPPRHWKSSLVSRKFPAWFIGKRHRDGLPHQVILTSYGASLAESNNRAVLRMCRDDKLFQNVFTGLEVSRNSQNVQEWSLAGEPFQTAVAAGVGGGLTGQGADCLIIDDPVKDRAEANSPAARKKLWEWWQDVARTRINPGGFCVIVMTRWHQDDLVGRLLQQAQDEPGNERIVMLRLPGLAETDRERLNVSQMGMPVDERDPLGRRPGQALWPEMYSEAELEATRQTSPRTFDALYQGRPTPEGGYLVGREHFKMLPSKPAEKDVRWVWGTDWALSDKELTPKNASDPDYTAGFLVGLWQPDGNEEDTRLVLADMVRGQHNIHDARRMVKQAALSTGPKVPIVGADNGRQIAVDHLALDGLRRDEELLNYRVKGIRMRGDKVTRAQPWLDRVHGGSVYVVEGVWNEEFFNEVENFPHGPHDDQIDAISAGIHWLGLGAKEKAVRSKRMNFYG